MSGIFTVQPHCLLPKSQASALHFPFFSLSLLLSPSLCCSLLIFLEWLFHYFFLVTQNILVPESPRRVLTVVTAVLQRLAVLVIPSRLSADAENKQYPKAPSVLRQPA